MSSQSQRWLGDVDELAARDQPVRIDHRQRTDHTFVVISVDAGHTDDVVRSVVSRIEADNGDTTRPETGTSRLSRHDQ